MFYLIVLEYAILASTFTLAKTALSYAKPFFLIGFRMTLAGSLMLGYLFLFQRKTLAIKSSDIVAFLKTSLFHVYIAFMFEFWALQYLTSAKTSIIYSSTPFFAAILSYLILGKTLTLKKVGAMALGFIGLMPMVFGADIEFAFALEALGISWPEIVLFISVISASYAWFIVSDLMKKGYSLVLINGFAMLVGGFASLATSLVIEGPMQNSIYQLGPFLFWTLLLVLVANVISYNFYGWLLKYYSITFMSFAGFLCPIFGSFFGWLFLAESITWHHFFALAMVTVGLTLFYRDDLKGKRES